MALDINAGSPIVTGREDQANQSPPQFIETGDGGAVVTPAGFGLMLAEFVRQGPDLLLEAPDGQQVLLVGYFETESPPAIMTEDGARLSPDLVLKLAGPIAPGQYALDGDAALGEPIGQVESASGTVTVRHADGTEVTVNAGDAIFQGDEVLPARTATWCWFLSTHRPCPCPAIPGWCWTN